MTFEARLADAYERYLAVAPVEVDPVTVAAVATASKPRRWALQLPAAGPKRRVVILGIVALLLLATIATAVLIVGRLNDRPRVPWVYEDQVVTAPPMPAARAFGQVVTLADGRVLILGGDSFAALTAAVFDPVTGVTTPTAPFPSADYLSIADAELMADGRVMVMGDLRPPDGPVVPVVEIFDPATMDFRDIGPMAIPRTEGSMALLGDGRLLITGGMPPNLQETTPDDVIREVEAYDPVTNAFSVVGRLPLQPSFETRISSLPDGGAAVALLATQPEGPPETQLYVFEPTTNVFELIPRAAPGSTPGPQLPFNVRLVPLHDGRVLFVGEVTDADGAVLPGVSIIWNPMLETFEATKAPAWQYDAAIELDDGRLLLLGLHDIEGNRPDSWAATFDLATGEATLLEGLAACSAGATKLIDGRVAFIGGLEDCAIHDGTFAPGVPAIQFFQ